MNIPFLSSSQVKLPKLWYGSRINPLRDWAVVLVAILLILAGFAVFAASQYFGGASSFTPQAQLPLQNSVSQETLADTERLFEERAEEARKYESEYQFVDPSR